jgi:hypothetical protein
VLPVSLSNPSCLSNCRTLHAVLAVPSVAAILKHEMSLCQAIGALIDAKEPLD